MYPMSCDLTKLLVYNWFEDARCKHLNLDLDILARRHHPESTNSACTQQNIPSFFLIAYLIGPSLSIYQTYADMPPISHLSTLSILPTKRF
jgi:hypothetical protein